MKATIIASVFFSLALGSQAFASNKVCFGSTKDYETKGVILKATISRTKITLKTIRDNSGQTFGGENSPASTYPTTRTLVHGRDGKIYLEYKGESTDYQVYIMVDSELLKTGTTGLLQLRARGEGFFNSVFVCKDASQPRL